MLFIESIWLSFLLFCLALPHYAKGGTFPRLTVHTQQGSSSEILRVIFFLTHFTPVASPSSCCMFHIQFQSTNIVYFLCSEHYSIFQKQKHINKAPVLKVGEDLQSGHSLFLLQNSPLSQREPWRNGQFNPSNKEWVGIVFQSILVSYKV